MPGKSLIKTLTTGSTALIIGVFVVALTIECWNVFSLADRALRNQLDQHLTLLSRSLENPLWSLDDNTIKLVGDAYMAGNASISLEVTASHTDTPVYSSQKPVHTGTLYGQREIVHDNRVIGMLRIGLSSEDYAVALSRLMTYSVALAFMIILSLAIGVRILIKRRLGGQLSSLGVWVDRVASGVYDQAPPSIELDELSSLAQQFDNMSKTIQKRERELVNYRDHLQLLVDEQTQKLKDAHEELLQQERLATLGRLTATVSHELRNPLGTIKTAVYTVGESLEPPVSQAIGRSLELAERGIDRCVKIIEELNSFARVKKLDCVEVEVDAWLQELLDEMPLPHDITLELDLASGVRAWLDREKLWQVIVNLVNNALDALQDPRSNGKLLKISSRRHDDGYRILVADNGCGMSDEVKSRMFEPLFSTKGFGIGLGMVVIKNIMEQHSGEVLVESRELTGTTVTLRLPIRPANG